MIFNKKGPPVINAAHLHTLTLVAHIELAFTDLEGRKSEDEEKQSAHSGRLIMETKGVRRGDGGREREWETSTEEEIHETISVQ